MVMGPSGDLSESISCLSLNSKSYREKFLDGEPSYLDSRHSTQELRQEYFCKPPPHK